MSTVSGKLFDLVLAFEERLQPLLRELKNRKLIPQNCRLPSYTPLKVKFLCKQQQQKVDVINLQIITSLNIKCLV